MKDINERILEGALGQTKLHPEEQRLFLGTFEERVIGYFTLDEANSAQVQKVFQKILNELEQNYQPLFVKIAPSVTSSAQITYLKIAKSSMIPASIMPEEGKTSPFGLVIHTDKPVDATEKQLTLLFCQFFKQKAEPKPASFWKKWFG